MNCKIKNCPSTAIARQMCAKHYARERRYGDASIVLRDKTPLPMRFWKNVRKTADCWLWQGRQTRSGYGVLSIEKKETLAHRYSFYLAHGEFPQDCCLHSCDVRLCVNPDHLRNGTYQDNSDDMVSRQRDRKVRGEDHPHSKLTMWDVRFIQLWHKRGYKQGELAPLFNIYRGTISRIVHKKRWAHI